MVFYFRKMNKKLKTTELNRLTNEEYHVAEKTAICIVLDSIRSLNNIGSVFRTSDAFRVNKIFLCGITAQPPHRDIQKTALGATETVEWTYFEKTTDAIESLIKDGYKIASVEQVENSIPLNDFHPNKDEKIALVLGNEVNGVEQEVINASDYCIEIPQLGTKHSLNISVCCGIVVWDIFQKLNS